VCVSQEPESLFIYHPDVLYGEGSPAAHAVLEAIYDGPIDLLDYAAEPVILETLPTLENGGVNLRQVTLGENEVFFNPVTLQPENLGIGDRYLPSGCNDPNCLATYSGGEVQMDQMAVEFRLREGILWSDGQPLTASDSRFSFTLDRSGELPTTKFLVDRTSDYRVQDDRTIRWVGIPGFMDSDYMTNFWPPLPEHILGSYAIEDLLGADVANRTPIGWGAYVVSTWSSGELTLLPNELYSGKQDNPQAFDRVIFRFLSRGGDGAVQQILTDECDLVDESLLSPVDLSTARSLEEQGRLKLWSAPDATLVRLDYNLSPIDRSRPAFFQDQRTRQALAYCIDRSEIQTAFTGEPGPLPPTYINAGHPEVLNEADLVSFDSELGKDLLDQVGWVLDEDNPQLPRVAFGVPGVRTATPFRISLLTSDAEEILQLATLVKRDLEDCGIEVDVNSVPADELAEPYPDGPAFGRGFDIVLWAWPEWISPLCEMFAGWEIPSSTQPFGINATGYSSEAYDIACQQRFLSIPGMPGYQEALAETQLLFNEDLPAVPLYQPLRWVVSDTQTCDLSIDGVATSSLWNIEVLDSGGSCP
jgi:peptide/nickel transport system substrate-binding protein